MKEGKYEALDIALYTINKCLEIGRPISNLQLQKILYYEQGYYIAIKNRPLFDDMFIEEIESMKLINRCETRMKNFSCRFLE